MRRFAIDRLKTRLRNENDSMPKQPPSILTWRCGCGVLIEMIGKPDSYTDEEYHEVRLAWDARRKLHLMHCEENR